MRCEWYVDGHSCGLPAYWYTEDIAVCEDHALMALRAGDPVCATDFAPVGIDDSGEIERVA